MQVGRLRRPHSSLRHTHYFDGSTPESREEPRSSGPPTSAGGMIRAELSGGNRGSRRPWSPRFRGDRASVELFGEYASPGSTSRPRRRLVLGDPEDLIDGCQTLERLDHPILEKGPH